MITSHTAIYESEDNENRTSSEPPYFIATAIQTGISDNSSGIPDLTPFCPIGNCTWEPYNSLAVCVRWADVSSKLQRSAAAVVRSPKAKVANWSLDNRTLIRGSEYNTVGLNVSNTAEPVTEPDVDYHIEFSGLSAFKDSSAPLAHFFVTYRNGSTSDNEYLRFSAVEFLLEWCVQAYKTEVKSGVSTTTRLKARKDFQNSESGQMFIETAHGDSYYVPGSSSYSLPDYLRKTFSGSIFEDRSKWVTKTSDVAEAFHSKLKADLWRSSDLDSGGLEDAGVRTAMVQIVENVATSMTNA